MRNLHLEINMSGWRIFSGRRVAKAFLPLARQVWARDQYTCQYCGFQAKEYQDVINLDGDYSVHRKENLITACCFCSQCLFLQTAGIDDISGGNLVYLPEMSQADLNSFCHVLFCAMGNSTGYQETGQSVYRGLKFRSQIVENVFGAGTSTPAVLGQLLLEHYGDKPKEQATILKDIRLLPSHTKFRIQLESWAKAALEELESKKE